MNLRALIVDDDSSWQGILSEMLSDNGFEVDTASTVDEAVAALKANSHRLAVVDLSLSASDHNNQDGLRVLDAVRLLDPACRAILLTGFATVEVAVKALTEYNAFTFLRKESFKRVEFKDVIQRILISAPTTDEGNASALDPKPDSVSQAAPPPKLSSWMMMPVGAVSSKTCSANQIFNLWHAPALAKRWVFCKKINSPSLSLTFRYAAVPTSMDCNCSRSHRGITFPP